MKMNKAKVVGGLIAAILLTATMTGCGSSEPEVTQPQYTTVPVERGDVIRTVYAPGELIPRDTLALSSPVDSELLDLLVKPGERVKKGDMLAHLDKESFEEAYENTIYNLKDALAKKDALELALLNAQISLKTAKYNLKMAQDLYMWSDIKIAQADVDEAERYLEKALWKLGKYSPGSEGAAFWQKAVIYAQSRLNAAKDRLEAMLAGTDPEEVAIKKLQVESAEMAVAQAQDNLEVAEERVADDQDKEDSELLDAADIRAPCDGTVLDIKFREGDIVTRDSPIIILADLNQMGLMVTVGQDKITSIRPGMSADIMLDAVPGTTLKGKVDYVVPQKSPTSQTVTYELYLSLDEAADGLLPGMTGGATILVAEKDYVLRVSRRLVKIAPDGSGRVEVLEQGQLVVREVVIGIRGDTHYEIVSGLSEGDLVIQRGRF